MWIEGWAHHSRHRIRWIALRPAFGRPSLAEWAAQAEALARRVRRALTGAATPDPTRQAAGRPDRILALDGMDIAVFRAATADLLGDIPLWIYWHDSQLGRPGPADPTLAVREAVAARAADRLLFNAEGHRQRFVAALQALDPSATIRATTLPPGFPLLPPFPPTPLRATDAPPRLLWIFRGDPEALDRMAEALGPAAARGTDFRLIVLSEDPVSANHWMERLPRELRGKILGVLRPNDPEVDRWAADARAILETDAETRSPIWTMALAARGIPPVIPQGSVLAEWVPEAPTWRDAGDLRGWIAEAARGQIAPTAGGSWAEGLRPYAWPVLVDRYDAALES